LVYECNGPDCLKGITQQNLLKNEAVLIKKHPKFDPQKRGPLKHLKMVRH